MRFFEGAGKSHMEHSPAIEAYRQKWIAFDRKAEGWLNSKSTRNPVQIVGELICARIQDNVNQRLGRMIREDVREDSSFRAVPSDRIGRGCEPSPVKEFLQKSDRENSAPIRIRALESRNRDRTEKDRER